MRAGLAGRQPATRRSIARRLGTNVRRVLALERRATVRLARACDTPADAGAVVLGASIDSVLEDTSELSEAVTVAAEAANAADEGRVLGVSERRAGQFRPMETLDDEDGRGGAVPGTLLAFLAVMLALLAAGVVATRRGLVPAAISAVAHRNDGRPLLFVDVDGVIALNPFRLDLRAVQLPPGAWHRVDFGDIYVTEQAGELLRTLGTRFELVWATGWERRANTYLPRLLGLDGKLALLRFGKAAAAGDSHWKIEAIDRFARHRPAAWIDDNIGPVHVSWAERRSAPTMLVHTDSHTGLTEAQVQDLLAWADALDRAKTADSPRAKPRTQTG